MAGTRTKSLLGLLDEPERRALAKALKSSFFTAKEFLHPLYKQLSQARQSHEKTPERIFAAVFPGKAFGNGRAWNRKLSELNTAIRQFLAIRQTLHDPGLLLQAELAALAGREDEKYYQQRVEAALATLKEAPESTDGWQQRFRLQQLTTAHRLANRMREPETPVDELDETLDCYHAICKLQLACNRASLTQFQTVGTKPDAFLLLLRETEALDLTGKSALLSLYRAALRLLTDPDARAKSFFQVLRTNAPRVERSELESILILGFNFCIRRYRDGDVRAFKWYYRIGFAWANKNRVWATKALPEAFILNTGVMFAKNQDKKGFEDFLENGPKASPKRRREKAVALLHAYQSHYTGDFAAAARFLPGKAEAQNSRYALLYHSLKVRNTFETWLVHSRKVRGTTNEYQLAEKKNELERTLGNFEDFLRQSTNPYSDSFRQSYHNLIWFIRQLSKRKPPKKEYLEKELQSRQPAVSDWVAAKISELPH